MILRENFHLGSRRLGTQHIRQVAKARRTTFIRGYGLVKLDQDQVEILNGGKETVGLSVPIGPGTCYFHYLPEVHEDQSRWSTRKLAGLNQKLSTNEVGKKISFLRPYQKRGVARLHALHALGCHPLLADEMGLEKPVNACLIRFWPSSEHTDLVTCPASVVPVWVKEAAKHFPKKKGKSLKKEETFENSEALSMDCKLPQLQRHRSLLDRVNSLRSARRGTAY